MEKIIYNRIIDSINTLQIVFFLSSVFLVTIIFVAEIILSRVRQNFNSKKKICYFGIDCGIILTNVSLCLISRERMAYLLVLFVLATVYFFITLLLPSRDIIVTKNQKALINSLDSALENSVNEKRYLQNEQNDIQLIKGESSDKTVGYKAQPVENKKNGEFVTLSNKNDSEEEKKLNNIDYSHIKNIIERLNYFGLTSADRRLVDDLELCIVKAERGESGIELKRRINDGLGALLKIMSKYGA